MMEGIECVLPRDVEMLRGFADPPLRRVWVECETVLMAVVDSRFIFSKPL